MTRRLALTALVLALLAIAPAIIQAQDNPLLVTPNTPHQTPPFDRIQISHYLPAVQEAFRQHNAEIAAIDGNPKPPTFENTITALDSAGELLARVTAVFYSLMGTNRDLARDALAEQISPLLTAHNDSVWLNDKLFARIKALYDKRASLKLTAEQLYLLEHEYETFQRNGALLNEQQKARFREINNQSSLLGLKFHQNVNAETNESYIVIDNKADLAGLPPSIIAMGEDDAKTKGLTGKWVYTSDRPSWTPFLQYSTNRELRRKLYTAYLMRCNRDNDHDNKAVVQKILTLREERSRLLGSATPADFLLQDHMAKTPQAVDSFLWSLWKPALNRAKGELAEMQTIADNEHAGFKIQSWDWWYYAEKLRLAKYDLDDSQLRPYFSLENVQKGAFTLTEKLYGVTFTERKDIPVYHPDVKAYEVHDANGTVLGILYTDYFPRPSKGVGAWSGGFRDACYRNGKRVIPFVTLVGNFTKPAPGVPSLLSVYEVQTLFHELGHALNSLFYQGHYRINFVPEDAGELPSQIMENWVLEPEFLKLYAKHFQTGAIIPDPLVTKIKNSRLFNRGFESVEYLANCILDMAWHELGNAKDVNVTNFEDSTMAAIGLIPEIAPRYHTVYFGHMLGGYSAGYYGYDWAAVLDADAFQAFKETSLFDKKTATSFRKNVLERLGIEDAMTLYKRFRGHEPKVEPFLQRTGLM